MTKKLRMSVLLGILGLVSLAAWQPSFSGKEQPEPEPEMPASIAAIRELWRRAEAGDAQARELCGSAWEGYRRLTEGGPRWDPLAELRQEGAQGEESNAVMARSHRLGMGVEQDFAAARRLALEALEEGAYGVYTDLGELYLAGQGVPQSDKEALRLFEEGSRRAVASSHRRLGDLYHEGVGVEADKEKAMTAYRRAAELGDGPAALALGKMYINEEGWEEDAEGVLRWFQQAANSGLAEAYYFVAASLLEAADGGAEGAELGEEVLELLAEVLHRAAAQGHEEAAIVLNMRYALGQLGPRRRFALTWWPGPMAELEDGQFVTNVVAASSEMGGCSADCGALLSWAVAMGDPRASLNLGLLSARGKGVERSPLEAIRHFRNAAAKGLPEAMNELGACYATGTGVGRDLEQAVAWYRKAAEAGDELAAFNLGLLYLHGEGVEKNNAESYRWMERAAARGDAVAVKMRDGMAAALAQLEGREEIETRG